MRKLLRRITDQSGFSLPLSLGIMLALSASTVTVMSVSTASQRHASTSNAGQKAFQLAEAGVNNAAGVLGKPDNLATTSTLLTPSTSERVQCPDGTSWCFRNLLDGGEALWFGTYDPAFQRWTITSWGVVPNPTSAALDVIRKLKAQITLFADPTQPVNATAWNFVIAWKQSTPTACDMSLTQGAQIKAPLYVEGNLCLSESSKVIQEGESVQVIVKGKLQVEDGTQLNKTKIGESSSQPIDLAEIVGGCTTNIANAAHTCNPASSGDRVWATTLRNTTTTTVTYIEAQWQYWYDMSNPGPKNACNPASSSPVFDNDGVLNLTAAPNGSVPTSFNLTPTTTSYTCKGYDSSTGRLMGELSWNHTTKTMTVMGVVYIDGSAYVDNNVTNEYDGQGTLYLSGTFAMSAGQTRLCGKANAAKTECNFNPPDHATSPGWDPNTDMLIIVTQGSSSGNGVIFSNAIQYQGGLFSKNTVDLGSAAHAEGPMMASTVRIAQSARIRPLPYITELPLGAPGNPNTHASPGKAVYINPNT